MLSGHRRLLGYTFNPLSVYFCYRADGELALLIYEVRDTFGELHACVLPVNEGARSNAGVRQSQEKLFYASPFIEMAMRYHFRVLPPGDSIRLRILETDRDGPVLAATFQWPPPRPEHGGVAAISVRAAAGDAEDRGRDPLGGAAALAQGRAAAAASQRCLQYPLGDRQQQPLYFAGVVRPRQEVKSGQSTVASPGNRHSMDCPCPS
jgi:Protein of unknown function (DUF1365)